MAEHDVEWKTARLENLLASERKTFKCHSQGQKRFFSPFLKTRILVMPSRQTLAGLTFRKDFDVGGISFVVGDLAKISRRVEKERTP
jgi:hypothetical protein